MSASYLKTSGAFIVDVNPLESNGPGNLSTPRQIVDVEFLDKSFITPTDAFIVNDDVSSRFVQGFVFTVVAGEYAGTYTVNAGAFAPGATVCQVVSGQTHIPVADIVSTAVPYEFVTGSLVNVALTTPGNYLVTWVVDGLPSLVANDEIQVKRIAYNDNVTVGTVNRNYTVVSATPNTPLAGQTTVVTALTDEQPSSTVPIIGINASSTFVAPAPTSTALGYTQYTVPTSATSLMLTGKGAPLFNNTTSWGNALQSNMIHMMEHFAHTVAPVSPMDGQLWFDTTAGPTAGPVLNLYSGAVWYGVVAEGLPVQGNINMNDFKIANVTNAATTYPYVASSTGWGNNDQEVMNLGTSDAMYIAKTGGYNADPLVRSGTMTGSLNMTGTAGINFKAAGSGNLTFESTSTGGIVVDGSGSITVATGNVVATAGNMRVGSGTNQVVTQNNAGLAPTITFTTSTTANNVINLNNNMLTGLSNAVNPTDAVSQQYGDGRYVNVTGDSMSGTLAMTGTANITLADGDIILGTGSNTISILRNGAAAGSIVFNTASASTTTGNQVINLGTNMITGLSAPLGASDATNKAYVDSYVSGIIWLRPVLDPSLFNDTLSAPPVDDGFTEYHRTYIVAGTGTGAWTGFNGHLMAYDGASWQSVLGRAVQAGDRFGVFCSPDNDDPLSTMPGGGLLNQAGKIAEVLTVSPYTYSFYTPAEPDAFSVVGVAGSAPYQSPHMGHSYTYRGVWSSTNYVTAHGWIVFSGPQMVVDGAGLRYDANVLNTDGNLLSLYNLATNGFVARTAANTVTARTLQGTTNNVTVTNGDGVSANPVINLAAVTQGAAGTSFVKVALDGFGRVTNNLAVAASDITTALTYTPVNKAGDTMSGNLAMGGFKVTGLAAASVNGDAVRYDEYSTHNHDATYLNVTGDALTAGHLTLFQDPATAMHATTKQYVDVARVVQIFEKHLGTVPSSQKVLLYVAPQAFTIAATPATPSSQGYADVAATASTTFDIQKNGVSIGSMVFAAAGTVASFTVTSATSFAAGDRLSVVAPASTDATLADVYFTIVGTLN